MASSCFPRKRSLLLLLAAVLCFGFLSTSIVSYKVSEQAIRSAIQTQELPLTSDTIYSEILKDLVRPVFISSMMASDTFLREWTVRGEKNTDEITRYLREVMSKYGSFTSFYVSEATRNYYHPSGVIKRVRADNPADDWYFRLRANPKPYEINVDPDMANHNVLTIFINFRVLDFHKRFLGAAGVGLNMESVRHAISQYQQRFGRRIYFVDRRGRIVLCGRTAGINAENIRNMEGLSRIAPRIFKNGAGSYIYKAGGETHLLNARYVPELGWYLFVEKSEDQALAGIRRTLYVNLAVCLLATLFVVTATDLAVGRYQKHMEELAVTDKLTGLLNRQTLDILFRQAIGQAKREHTTFCVVIGDIDRFKAVNDRLGHLTGDMVLRRVAALLRCGVRDTDSLCRWGGEEFLLILCGCNRRDATILAEKLRALVAEDAELKRLTGGLTISMGVAQHRLRDSQDSLVDRADTALYQAKQDGRNLVRTDADESSPT